MFALSASAAYPSLQFNSIDGSKNDISTEGLVLTIEGENLVATNNDNDKVVLPLNSLLTMQFSDTPASVAAVDVADSGSVVVFTADGVCVGSFNSTLNAVSVLAPGIYLIQNSKGETFKTVVGK